MLPVHHSLLALFSRVTIFSPQSVFTTLTCETIENRRRTKARQEAQIIPMHPTAWFISSSTVIFSAFGDRTSTARRMW
ncbi:hypothetical protein QQF64_035333 [Cirrhinus molitorella]|uniref:Secreted protein n=1 Tax=Cirrhinus molitorella TaxID=172907 RepID=A0ABR3NGB2_9TELE